MEITCHQRASRIFLPLRWQSAHARWRESFPVLLAQLAASLLVVHCQVVLAAVELQGVLGLCPSLAGHELLLHAPLVLVPVAAAQDLAHSAPFARHPPGAACAHRGIPACL